MAAPDHHSRRNAHRLSLEQLELFGIATLFYGLATVAESFAPGQLSGLLEERRSQRMIDSYSDHHIICGSGRGRPGALERLEGLFQPVPVPSG